MKIVMPIKNGQQRQPRKKICLGKIITMLSNLALNSQLMLAGSTTGIALG